MLYLDRYYIGIEIGGTNFRIGVVDEKFTLLEFEKTPTAALAQAEDKIEFLFHKIKPYIEKYGKENILAISMALASLMDRDRTRIYSSPMIPGFENMQLVALLKEKMGIPVVMEKDVNILLLYEIWKNQLPQDGIIAGTFLGTGLGNAMCIDGNVYRGNSGTACELGHIPVPDLETRCGCGKKGCIELLSCGKVLYKLAVEKYACPVEKIFHLRGKEKDVLDVVRYCAAAIATEVTILDPVCMILGGGVVEMESFPIEYLLNEVRENLRIPNPRESLTFIMASGDAQAGVVGAAINTSLSGRLRI
ncbi:MAG TPA: allose kinase [Candidatus Pelethocola excrementipullorum]|nr:allose kinase [Candidatus Pelethocola excrementipullorum]